MGPNSGVIACPKSMASEWPPNQKDREDILSYIEFLIWRVGGVSHIDSREVSHMVIELSAKRR